tara:strand:- start:452 stop:952 length:501 start_codon:yes stop_codon:yes gene_type:complete
MKHFSHLRNGLWKPTFTWVETLEECADRINFWHEDYPTRVPATERAIRDMQIANPLAVSTPIHIGNRPLLEAHRGMFGDQPFAGEWRQVGVRIGPHRPPNPRQVHRLMDKLATRSRITGLGTLKDWYHDFETIHPFQDGNGRVGGVTVAVLARKFRPEKGWLAPGQ